MPCQARIASILLSSRDRLNHHWRKIAIVIIFLITVITDISISTASAALSLTHPPPLISRRNTTPSASGGVLPSPAFESRDRHKGRHSATGIYRHRWFEASEHPSLPQSGSNKRTRPWRPATNSAPRKRLSAATSSFARSLGAQNPPPSPSAVGLWREGDGKCRKRNLNIIVATRALGTTRYNPHQSSVSICFSILQSLASPSL